MVSVLDSGASGLSSRHGPTSFPGPLLCLGGAIQPRVKVLGTRLALARDTVSISTQVYIWVPANLMEV